MQTFVQKTKTAGQTRPVRAAPPVQTYTRAGWEPEADLRQQRALGTQAAQRLLQAEADRSGGIGAASSHPGSAFGRNSDEAPARTFIQADLEINQPGDVYEQEADQIADQIIRTPDSPDGQNGQGGSGTRDAQDLPAARPIHRLQTSSIQSRQAGTPGAPASLQQALASSGQPLAAGTRGFMEGALRADFSQVRVHTGDQAADAARAIQARAFTAGQEIVFGAGQYAPEASEGRRLIAHELAHVLQQGAGKSPAGGSARRVQMDSPKTTAPTAGELAAQLRAKRLELVTNFNFEMNEMQTNLALVTAIINTQAIPKSDFGAYFLNRLVSEGVEEIPFGPLAEGLKILWDAYSLTKNTDKAAEAAKRQNQINQFAATSNQDLLEISKTFAWWNDEIQYGIENS